MNDLEALAQSIARSWRTGDRIALPPSESAPRSRAEAFAVQQRVLDILGDRRVGWKIGSASPAALALPGKDGPVYGSLLAPRLYTSPARLPAQLFGGYKLECEAAFRFSRTIRPRPEPYARAELVALAVLHFGIEVAGYRYAMACASRDITPYDVIADNGACGAYIEGPAIEDWQDIDFATLPIQARIDGGETLRVLTGSDVCHPVDILVDMVNSLSGRGIAIEAGDLLTTGTLTEPVPMNGGQTFVARFADLATLSVGFDTSPS